MLAGFSCVRSAMAISTIIRMVETSLIDHCVYSTRKKNSLEARAHCIHASKIHGLNFTREAEKNGDFLHGK